MNAQNKNVSRIITTNNLLMDLRLAILRTIARVWENDTKAGKSASEGPLRKKLTNPKFDCEQTDKELAEVGYVNPLVNFGIKFIPGSAIFNQYGDGAWSKAEKETITLTLPSYEMGWSDTEKVKKLMEYYQRFPSFFGATQYENKNDIGPELKSTVSSKSNITLENVTGPAVDLSGNSYDLGVSQDAFLGFGALVNKLIAIAWTDRSIKNKLDYEYWQKDDKTKDDDWEEKYYSHITQILKHHFAYQFPWEFRLRILFADIYKPIKSTPENQFARSKLSFWVKSDNNKWLWRESASSENPLSLSRETSIVRNYVELEIPATPTDTRTDISLALARYNAIGPAYPFTCS